MNETRAWELLNTLNENPNYYLTLAAQTKSQYDNTAKWYEQKYKSSGAEKIFKELIDADQNLKFANDISQGLNTVKSGGIWHLLKMADDEKMTISDVKVVKDLKEKWESIMREFEVEGRFDDKHFKAVKTQYETLKKYVDKISDALKAQTQNVELRTILSEVKTYNSNGHLANAIQGLMNGLVGEKLEGELAKKISELTNFEHAVIQTGGMKNLDGKSVKSDIMLIPPGTSIEVNGHKYIFSNNGEILIDGKKEENIKISTELEKLILKSGGVGITAKATEKAMVFHSGYSIDDHLNKTEYYQQLLAMYQYGVPKGTKPEYWTRYFLSTDIKTIVGINNFLLVSAKKVTPMHEYLNKIGTKYNTQLHFTPTWFRGLEGRGAAAKLPTSNKVVGGHQ